VAAGWNLITSGTDISSDSAITTSTNYYDLTDSTTASFGSQAVNFGRFKEAEPESTATGALSSIYLSCAALATATIANMF